MVSSFASLRRLEVQRTPRTGTHLRADIARVQTRANGNRIEVGSTTTASCFGFYGTVMLGYLD